MNMIRNLTPHKIVVFPAKMAGSHENLDLENLEVVSFEPEGVQVRLAQEYKGAPEVNGFPCVTASFGAVEGLPEPKEGVFLIVAAMIKAACPERSDLICPDTNKGAVRENGRIVGTTRFIR
jgi:hypothetical protein